MKYFMWAFRVAVVALVVIVALNFHRDSVDTPEQNARADSIRQGLAQRAAILDTVKALRDSAIVAHAVTQEAQRRADSAVAESKRMRSVVRAIDSTHVVVTHSDGSVVAAEVPMAVITRFADDSGSIARLDSALGATHRELDLQVTENKHLLAALVVDSVTFEEYDRQVKSYRRHRHFGFKSGVAVGIGATVLVVKIVRAIVKKPP
jgi:hypothetical protein